MVQGSHHSRATLASRCAGGTNRYQCCHPVARARPKPKCARRRRSLRDRYRYCGYRGRSVWSGRLRLGSGLSTCPCGFGLGSPDGRPSLPSRRDDPPRPSASCGANAPPGATQTGTTHQPAPGIDAVSLPGSLGPAA